MTVHSTEMIAQRTELPPILAKATPVLANPHAAAFYERALHELGALNAPFLVAGT